VPEPTESQAEREKRERRERQEQARRLRELLGTEPEPDQGPSLPPGIAQREALLAVGPSSDSLTEARRDTQRSERQRERTRLAARLAEERRRAAERGRAYDRGVGSGIDYDINTNVTTARANAIPRGTIQGVTLGGSDELFGALRAPFTDLSYAEERDIERNRNREAREAAPEAYDISRAVGSTLPALAIPTARAPSVLGRVAQSGLYGSGFGGAEGFLSAEGDLAQQATRTAQGVGTGFVGGAAGQLLGEGIDAAGRYRRGEAQSPLVMPRARRGPGVTRPQYTPEELDAIRRNPELRVLEDQRQTASREAAAQRVMGTAGAGATRTDLQRAADYPGGLEQLSDDITEFGIVRPEDSTLGIIPPSGDLAQQRARFLAEDAGRSIGAAETRMRPAASGEPLISNVDEMERLTAEARAAARPEPQAVTAPARRARPRAESFADLNTPTPPAGGATPDALAGEVAETQALIRANDPTRVDMGAVAQRLRAEARNLRAGLDPVSVRRAAELEALADTFVDAGRIPYDAPQGTPSARGVLERQREAAQYGERAADANRPYASDQARYIQRQVREEMDNAMRRELSPTEMERHLRDRRAYGTSQAVTRIGDAAESRRLGNRQVPLSDNIQVATAEGILGKARAFVANRIVRGREHAFMAMLGEHRANDLAAQIARRLAESGSPRAAALLDTARRQGSPLMGNLIREYMESSPEAQAEVAREVARIAPEEVHQFAAEDDPTGGFGSPVDAAADPSAEPDEPHQFADEEDPAGGF
jgi:hypothetical protein